MRPSVLFYTLCTSLMLAGCSLPDGLSTDQLVDNSFNYNEQDFVPNDDPLPDGINQRPIVGVKKVLVSVIHWQDGDTLNKPLIEKHTISTDPDSLRSYILAASLGKLTLDGQVISFTSGPRPDTCKSGGNKSSLAAAEGVKAAQANGLDPSSFDYLINVIDCGGGGSAVQPGRVMGIYGQAGSPHVYKHEFGHNLGYAHGNTYTRCPKNSETVSAPTDCHTVGFGDTGDSVSGGGTLYPAFNRWYSGWLDASQAVTIKSTGIYSLGALGTSGPQLYLIERPGNGTRTRNFLSLEFRRPTFFDNFSPNDNRVTGVWARFSTLVYYSSYMINTQLDGTPETATTADPTLQPGRTLVDDAAGITVHVCATTSSDTEKLISVGINGEKPPSCSSSTPVLLTPKNGAIVDQNSLFSGYGGLSPIPLALNLEKDGKHTIIRVLQGVAGKWEFKFNSPLEPGDYKVTLHQFPNSTPPITVTVK